MTGNVTFTFTGATSGVSCAFTLLLRQDGTGSRTVTWPTVTWLTGTAPVLATTAGALSVLLFFSLNGGTTWYGSVVQAPPALPLSVANGGTGAASAGAALTALGAAPLASPALTGTPTAPTPTGGDSTTKLATTAFVGAAVAVTGMAKLAGTAAAGYTLVNSTGTIISWTAPNDGAMHRVLLFAQCAHHLHRDRRHLPDLVDLPRQHHRDEIDLRHPRRRQCLLPDERLVPR